MDRRDIVNKEFPTGRRGYEPEAVDAHLAWIAGEVETIAGEVETLRGAASKAPRAESLATAASERVRTILEAAETSAAEIEREAEEDARRLREESTAEAERTRSDASAEAERTRSEAAADAEQTRNDVTAEAQGHVASVREATSTMLERVESLEKEASSLVDTLRSRGTRLTGDLDQLETEIGELRGASGAPPAAPEPEPEPLVEEPPPVEEPPEPLEPERTLIPTEAAGDEAALLDETEETTLDELEVARAEDEELLLDEESELDEAPATTSTGGDTEGARLIALNMALNGTSRDETDRYLAENFSIEDREGLLDEVYARLG